MESKQEQTIINLGPSNATALKGREKEIDPEPEPGKGGYGPVQQTQDLSRRICWTRDEHNNGRPHVAVAGKYDGRLMYSCLWCGCWLDEAGNAAVIEELL